MERLRQSELRSLLAFVEECYSICEPEPFHTFAQRLVCVLPRLIPAVHVTYNEMYPEESESYNCINNDELATGKAAELWAAHMNEHPVMHHVLETPDRHARRISDFWSRTQLHDRGLHADFYKQYDIEDALCITIPCRRPRIIGVGWHDHRVFTERERLLADLARPHIAQAWQIARLLACRKTEVDLLGLGVGSLGAGVILSSNQGRILFIDSRARRYLADYLAIGKQVGLSLPDTLLRWVQAQNLPLNSSDDAPPPRLPLKFFRTNKCLLVRLLSKPGEHLILMEEQQTTPADDLAVTHALTPREADVLHWIAGGKTNGEIATILQMQTGTAKKHVEHILAKLGVETRTAAAAMVLGAHPNGEPGS